MKHLSWLAKASRHIARLTGDGALTPEEREFSRGRLERHDLDSADSTMVLGVAFNGCVVALAPFIVGEPYCFRVQIVTAISFFVDASWVTWLRRFKWVKASWLIYFLNLALIWSITSIVPMSVALNNHNVHLLGMTILMALAPILVIISPFSNFMSPVMAGSFFIEGVILAPFDGSARQWLVSYLVALVFGSLIQRASSAGIRRQAVLELRARQAELKAAAAKLERDLELARGIQDSMTPPEHSSTPEGWQVSCFQHKHDKVAGDWMAMHRWPDGTFAAMLVDATGKGFQAALIVHAIQSLWATALDEESFDPEAWLARVNRALRRLGEKESHSATIGLAIFKDKRISYWSAGHLPLFLLLGGQRATTFKTLNSRGNLLGLGYELDLTVQYIDLAPGFPVRVMLCSDGVIEKGYLAQKSELEGLYELASERGAACLNASTALDDKTLIIIERPAAAKRRQGPLADAS